MICRKLGTFSDASLPAAAVNNIKEEGRGGELMDVVEWRYVLLCSNSGNRVLIMST